MNCSFKHCNCSEISLSTETLGCRWHHFLPVRRPGSWGVPGDGADPVRHYGGGSCAVSEEDRDGKGHLSGHPGLRHSLLDVLHSPRSHWQVWLYTTNDITPLLMRFKKLELIWRVIGWFNSAGVSVRTRSPSSGTLWSASTSVSRPIRSAADTRPACWETSWPRAIITSISSSSRGEEQTSASCYAHIHSVQSGNDCGNLFLPRN